eukprot:7036786-Pyramimonas_sp.AAC.1
MPSDHIPVVSHISMCTPDKSECKNIPLWLAKSPGFADELDRLLSTPPADDGSAVRLAWTKECMHSAAARARRRIKHRVACRGVSSLVHGCSPWPPSPEY